MVYSVLLCLCVQLFFAKSESVEKSFEWNPDEFSIFPRLPIALTWSEDEVCRRDSETLLTNLKNQTFWAIQMYDSSAQQPFGFLYGNSYQLGSFDECMLVKSPIMAHMCLAYLTVDSSNVPVQSSNPFLLDPPPESSVWNKIEDSKIDVSKFPRYYVAVALCVPRSCRSQEVVRSLSVYLENINEDRNGQNQSTYSVHMEGDCADDEQPPIAIGEAAFWYDRFLLTEPCAYSLSDVITKLSLY